MNVLGLDIGGANIKAATSAGVAVCLPFSMWKEWENLSGFIQNRVLTEFPGADVVAVTMTGELCDCFDSKAAGVAHILNALDTVFHQEELHVYSVEGLFLSCHQAKDEWSRVAASNWHALANFVTRYHEKSAEMSLLIDLGSTSTDIIPVSSQVEAVGTTDTTRIANHELVYTGAIRTPVCALIHQFDFRNRRVAVAHEVFATMQDVYTILKERQENSSNFATADGRSQTIENSKRRLARMVCADLCEVSNDELIDLALQAKERQVDLVADAIQRQLSGHPRPVTRLISSGSGDFVVRNVHARFPDMELTSLNSLLGTSVCESAPAFAVAKLCEETQC